MEEEQRVSTEEPEVPAEESVAAPEESIAPAGEDVEAAPDTAPIAMPMPVEETAQQQAAEISDAQLQAVVEAVVYVAEEPLTLVQMANALAQPAERVETVLRQLIEEFERAEHGIGIREVAGGYKMATKAEHHEAVRGFVKSLKPPLKLSLPALETLAVIAYKQPVTKPEIMEIRGVQGAGVLNTLLDRKLIAAAGRKNVVGKPILYKTTKEFLIQFGLKDIGELPSLKEFEEIRRMAFGDSEAPSPAETAPAEVPPPAAVEPAEATPPPAPEPQADGVTAPQPEVSAPVEPKAED
jgi:segregation and condensation protein B